MLCQGCPKRRSCFQLCPEAERYVAQDERYQREKNVSFIVLETLTRPYAIEVWLARDGEGIAHKPPKIDLCCLSPRQRECVELHFFQGLSLSRAAAKLGVSKAAVQFHLREGLARLRPPIRFSYL